MLEGKAYKLQFPWIGVVNRSQADINKNLDMIAARRREREYFSSTPECRHLAHRMGSEHLGEVLSEVCHILSSNQYSGVEPFLCPTKALFILFHFSASKVLLVL